MKKFTMFSNYLFLLMAAAVLGLTACGDDPILNTELAPTPSISASEIEVDLGENIILSISGIEGDAAMDLLTITEDGNTIDLTRIISNDIGSNPASLLGDNANAFAFTVEIEGPTVPGVYTYGATIRDLNSNADVASVDVSVLDEVAVPPTVTYAGQPSLVKEFEAGTTHPTNFNISAVAGNSDLSTITVYENGIEIADPSRLAFDGAVFDANPYFLVGDDISGFDMAAVLVRFSDIGVYALRFEVTDVNGEMVSTEEVTLEIVDAGTPLNVSYPDAVLLSNADGPAAAKGGLDLDTGTNVSSSDDTRDIIDLGLNTTTGEWRQEIQGVLGTTVVAADPNQLDLFNFANVNSRELLIDAFTSGVSIGTVNLGDIFIANKNDDYYIMEVTELDVTPNDNLDSYRFQIKGSKQ